MTYVKFFTSTNMDDLENKVNDYISLHREEPISISFQATMHGCAVAVILKENEDNDR